MIFLVTNICYKNFYVKKKKNIVQKNTFIVFLQRKTQVRAFDFISPNVTCGAPFDLALLVWLFSDLVEGCKSKKINIIFWKVFLHRPRLIVGQKHFCDGNWKQAGHTHTSRQLKINKRCKKNWPLCNKSGPGPKTTGRAAEIKSSGKRHKNISRTSCGSKKQSGKFH